MKTMRSTSQLERGFRSLQLLVDDRAVSAQSAHLLATLHWFQHNVLPPLARVDLCSSPDVGRPQVRRDIDAGLRVDLGTQRLWLGQAVNDAVRGSILLVSQ